jgi:hypothetical protein
MGGKSRKKKERKAGAQAQRPYVDEDIYHLPGEPDFDDIFEEGEDYDDDEMDEQTQRILSILSVTSEGDAAVSRKNLSIYLAYLKKELELPCIVTGIEDMGGFAWEEYYLFGPGDRKEYEELRKIQPSFKDRYMLTALDDEPDDEEGLIAFVQRISDKKDFVLILEDLRSVEKKSKNAQLLDDYSCWQVNFNW